MTPLPAPTRRATRLTRRNSSTRGRVNPFRIHEFTHGTVATVPDPIDWVVRPEYLDRPNLYPRQATWLKVIFLRDDLFTAYDHDVIGEWEQTFLQTGTEGISPGIHQRIALNKAAGRPWFRETQGVIGRRGSKGYTGALAGSYVLWNYMHRPGGPQAYYGIDRDKRLTGIVFAGKKEQALANQWRDLSNVILGGPCFAPYVSRPQAERLTIFAPTDILRAERQRALGIETEADLASFEIIPAPSTTMAARGPTSFMQFYDEQAHVISSTSNADAGEVYACLDPTTPVLTSDLRWVPIRDVRIGDELVSLDEHPPGAAGTPRKLRKAVVLGTAQTKKVAYQIVFEDGSSVISSALHRWLRATPGDKNFKWATIARPERLGGNRWAPLQVGDRIRSVVDHWEVETGFEAGYLCGMFEAEGHVSFPDRGQCRIGFTQNPGPILDRMRGLLTRYGFTFTEAQASNSQCVILYVNGLDQCMRLVGKFGMERLRQNLDRWEGRTTARNRVTPNARTIVAIKEIGPRALVDIETSTKTFVAANGLVSHNSATPALDQFKRDGFIYAPSSPWAKTGQFFENWELSIAMEPDGTPSYPERMMLQLPSWGPYQDWEEADHIPLKPPVRSEDHGQVVIDIGPTFKPLKGAIQAYDSDMRQLERANPETFKVERRSIWAESLNAYLNPAKVDEMFSPWQGHAEHTSVRGILAETYVAHGDPATSNKRFGWAMAHRVWDPEREMYHVIYDVIRCWEPADYEDHLLDYEDVMGDIWEDVRAFMPEDVSFDQYNVPSTIGNLRKRLAHEQLPKQVRVREVSRTRPLNWKHSELFKSALNMDLLHAPLLRPDGSVNYASDEGRTELKFLEERNGAVDHPSSGPVQTKDISDAIMECTVALIGKQIAEFLGQEFDGVSIGGTASRGTDPGRHMHGAQGSVMDRLGALTNSRGMGGNGGAARGMRQR